MKKLIILLILCLAFASSAYANPFMQLIGAGVATSAYDGEENFETVTTGYEETWTEYNKDANTVNPVYSTSALRGSQSLQLTGIASGTVRGIRSSVFSAKTTFNLAFRWRIDTEPTSSGNAVVLLDTDGNIVARLVHAPASDEIYGAHGSATTGYSAAAVSTLYYIWLEYVADTGGEGNDGIFRVYVSSTTTKPVSATVSTTAGTSELGVCSFALVNVREGVTVFDQVIWDEDTIGNLDS